MSEKKLKHLSPSEAWQLIQNNPRAVLVDVRSTPEVLFVGHPRGSVHIPWLDEPDWTVNPHFVTRVRELMLGGILSGRGRDAPPIILICRSGKRSIDAGQALIDAGFTEIYNVLDGFEGDLDENRHRNTTAGWRFEGLPWEQC